MHVDLRGKLVRRHFPHTAHSQRAGAVDDHLDLAERRLYIYDGGGDRILIGDVHRERLGLAARFPNMYDDLVEPVDTARAHGHRVPGLRQGDGRRPADPRGRAQHEGRSAFGVARIVERERMLAPLGHQLSPGKVSSSGRWANPRTLVEWTRSAPGNTEKPATVSAICRREICASSRAMCAPRQK